MHTDDGNHIKMYAVLKALDKFDEIPGRKALQKILYFVNLKERIFPYQWNSYGPYSEEVKYMMEDMVGNGQISVERKKLFTGRRFQFNMKIADRGRELLDSIGQKPELDAVMESVHKLMSSKRPRMMELLASVHYIAAYENGLCRDRTFNIISTLKPDANFKQSDVDGAVSELERAGLLTT